jgi:hypothetical protein
MDPVRKVLYPRSRNFCLTPLTDDPRQTQGLPLNIPLIFIVLTHMKHELTPMSLRWLPPLDRMDSELI